MILQMTPDSVHWQSKLSFYFQEKEKTVPTLASSNYGHRIEETIDERDRQHVRIGYVKSEFYRRNGIDIDTTRGKERQVIDM